MHQALTVDVVLNRSVGVDGHGPVDPSTVDPHRRSHEDTLQHMREGEYEGGIVSNVNTVMALLADLVWWFLLMFGGRCCGSCTSGTVCGLLL